MQKYDSPKRRGSAVLSRRQLMGGALTALASSALASAGCSRDKKQENAGTQGALAPAGGELIIAFDGAGVSNILLDPQNSGYAPHNRVMRSIYDSLTRLLPDQSVGPWLAESWELSPDRTSYEFKLREGVTFHDGTPFDAKALKANFERISDPKNALSSRTSLGPYLSSEVLGSHSLRVRLSEPFTPFLRNLSMTKLAIVSPAAVEKYGKGFNLNPVATGPFRFVKLVQGRAVHLERNPDYRWGPQSAGHQGPAHVERLTFMNVPEESTRIAVLQSGQVHASDLIPAQNLRAFRADARFSLLEKELLNTNYALALNVSREPWNDEEIRLAVRLSLDIDTIVRSIYFGNFPRAWSSLSTSMFGSAEKELTNSWKPDPERAKQLLTQKGWLVGEDGIRTKEGKKLEIRFVDSQGNREKRLDVIQVVRHQLKAVGIRLYVDSQPGGVTSAALAQNNFDLSAGASFHGDPDILRQAYSPEIRSAISGNKVVDSELISWLRDAAREPDGPARADLYKKVQRKILDKTYAIPIYVLPYNVAVSKAVQGVSIDAHGFPEFYDARFSAES
jgi:peptide/nickel transport system substrate-binding protein